jgi:hypothetical protein
MSRPTKKDVDSGLEGWDADMDDNFDVILSTPFPPAEYATVAALPSAALYEGCVAYVANHDRLFISHGGSWQPVPESHYETSEKDSGWRWIDDSIIYMKTISLGALPNSSTKNVAHGASIDQLIKIEGAAEGASNQIPLPYYHATNGVDIKVNNTNVVIVTTDNKSTYTGYVTLFYLQPS